MLIVARTTCLISWLPPHRARVAGCGVAAWLTCQRAQLGRLATVQSWGIRYSAVLAMHGGVPPAPHRGWLTARKRYKLAHAVWRACRQWQRRKVLALFGGALAGGTVAYGAETGGVVARGVVATEVVASHGRLSRMRCL